jgi:hypothetical protein
MTESSGANGANGRTVPVPNGKASYAEKHSIADHFIGGNRLANAPPSKVKDFVTQHDGHTVITNVSSYSEELGGRGIRARAGDFARGRDAPCSGPYQNTNSDFPRFKAPLAQIKGIYSFQTHLGENYEY